MKQHDDENTAPELSRLVNEPLNDAFKRNISALPQLPAFSVALLDSMSEGVRLTAEDGTIVYTNAAEDRMFGYQTGELVGLPVSVQNAYPPDENARKLQSVIVELKRTGAWRGQWRNRRKDGSEFISTSRISAVEMEGRSYWLCVQEDVTADKVTADQLRESEARLTLATDAASIGIWEWDLASGRMTYSSHAKAICGFLPEQDVTYDDVRVVTHPDDYPKTSAMARRALDPALREEAPYEYRIVRPDGAIRWVLAHGKAIFEDTTDSPRALRYVGTLQDITERHRLEEADRLAKSRLDLALHAGKLAVWEIDLVTDEVKGSPELNRILGFPEDANPTAAEMRARYYPGEQERLEALGAEVLARGERTLEAEYRYLFPDGSIRWLWLRAEGVLDAKGTPVHAIGVLTDITERRHVEAALRTSESRLDFLDRLATATGPLVDADEVLATTTRMLGEHLGLSICAYADMDDDQDGFTIRGNWAALGSTSIVGHYSLTDFGTLAVGNLCAGKPLILNDTLQELAPEEAATFGNIGIAATICMPLVKEGRLIALMAIHNRIPRVWTEGELSLLREVTERSWAHIERVGALADLRAQEAELRRMNADLERQVVERTLAQEALRYSEEQLRLATDAADVGLWDLDVMTDTLFWPPRVKAMFGISADMPVSMADYYAGLHPDDAEPTVRAFAAALDPAQRSLYDVEFRTLGKQDGIQRWVAAKGRGVFDDQNRCVRVIGTAIDITNRKRSEAQLRDLNEMLERRVAERTAELERAHTRILSERAQRENAERDLLQAQKLETIGQLTGGVAHDFNNLLAAIMSNLELLAKRTAGDERASRLIDGAMQGAHRGATLTQRMLAFARRQELKIEPHSLASLVERADDLLRRSVGDGIDLALEFAQDIPHALVDDNQFDLALLNLVINARDAMPNGGRIVVRVDHQPGTGEASDPPEGYVRLVVADDGQGMDEATLEKATLPFFSTKGVGKGTGLGLSMIHGLALQLRGRLHLESRVGEGTTAELWLPAAKSAPTPADVPVAPPGRPRSGGQPLRVLLVDDDVLISMSTVDMLEDLGHVVVSAYSGKEALEVLEREPSFDLVITDFSMPKMNGGQLAAAVRARLPDLPILLATGYAELPAYIDLKLPKLSKPYAQFQLQVAIEALVDRAA